MDELRDVVEGEAEETVQVPARTQRGELGCPDVGYPLSGDQLPGRGS